MEYDKILSAKNGDEKNMITLIEEFNPLVRKYARKLNYEDAECDLNCFFIELIRKFPISKFEPCNEGGIITYLSRSLKNQYILLMKNLIKHKNVSVFSEMSEEQIYMIECKNASYDTYNVMDFETLKSLLNEKEFKVILLIYMNGYTSAEIARKENITRQAVNQIKIKAIKKLKKANYS